MKLTEEQLQLIINNLKLISPDWKEVNEDWQWEWNDPTHESYIGDFVIGCDIDVRRYKNSLIEDEVRVDFEYVFNDGEQVELTPDQEDTIKDLIISKLAL